MRLKNRYLFSIILFYGKKRKNIHREGYTNFVVRTSRELDLRNQQAVNDFFEQEKPEYVFLAAAKVGGIHANNTQRGAFLYENLMIQNNVIHAAYLNDVEKLMFLGSSCIYPKFADQPLREDYLLTGALEPTNEPYAIAKIAGSGHQNVRCLPRPIRLQFHLRHAYQSLRSE